MGHPNTDVLLFSPNHIDPRSKSRVLYNPNELITSFTIHGSNLLMVVCDFFLRIDNSRQGRYSSGRGYP